MKAIMRKVKDQAYDPIEVKVRDATSSDAWGASSTLMTEIADATTDYVQYQKLLTMLWKRLTDHAHYLHVYKALLLIDYLIRNGSERFVHDAQVRIEDVKKLKTYFYRDEDNREIANDARERAAAIVALLTNPSQLKDERDKAQNIKRIFKAHISSDDSSVPSSSSTSNKHEQEERDPYDRYSSVSKQIQKESPPASNTEPKSKPSSQAQAKPKSSKPKKTASTDDNPFDDTPADPFAEMASKKSSTKVEAIPESATTKKTRKPHDKAPAEKDFGAELVDALGGSTTTAKTTGDIDFLSQQLDSSWQQQAQDDDDEPAPKGRVEWGPDADTSDKKDNANSLGDVFQLESSLTNIDDLSSDKKHNQQKQQGKQGPSISQLMANRGSVTVMNPIPDFAPSQPSHGSSKPTGLDAFFPSAPAPAPGPPLSFGMPPAYPSYPPANVMPSYPAYPYPPQSFAQPPMYPPAYPSSAMPPSGFAMPPASSAKKPQTSPQNQNPFDF